MSTRLQKFNHVLDVLGIVDPTRQYLVDNQIPSITRMTNSQIYDTAIENGEVSEADASELKMFQSWYRTVYDAGDGVEDVTVPFTEAAWEHFIAIYDEDAEEEAEEQEDAKSTRKAPAWMKTDLRSYPSFSGKIQDWVVLVAW